MKTVDNMSAAYTATSSEIESGIGHPSPGNISFSVERSKSSATGHITRQRTATQATYGDADEAIPAFAVGLLVIGWEITILGRPDGVFAEDSKDWERFIEVWGSPLIWLFFGGVVLASAAEKTGLTVWGARNVLRRLGKGPRVQLLGWMIVTFVFSMFISNTATATIMITMMMPLIRSSSADDLFGTGLLLGVVVAANLGGMGTVPIAIAASAGYEQPRDQSDHPTELINQSRGSVSAWSRCLSPLAVLPASTNPLSCDMSIATSAGCKPVVGLSRT